MLDLNQKIEELKPSGIRRLFSIAQEMEDVISFGLGEPDYATPEHIVRAGIEALEQGHHHYTPNLGYPALREAIAEKVRKENKINVTAGNVVVTHGGAGALLNAFMAIANPGDEFIIPDPGFLYEPYVAYVRGTAVRLPLRGENNFHVDLDDLKKCITPKTKALVINSPQNPSGVVYTEDELKVIAELAIEHDFYIIADEVYEKMIYDGKKHISIGSLPGMFERTITVNSLSKTYAMTGWRAGYAVCREDIVEQMLKIQQNVYTCVNAATQMAALAAVTGPQTCVEEMHREYDLRRKAMFNGLKDIPGIKPYYPEATFYMLVDVSGLGVEVNELSQHLLMEHHVAVVPGDSFGPNGKNYFRLCFTVPVPVIEKGLQRFKEGIEKFIK